jgi:hypothetical protein
MLASLALLAAPSLAAPSDADALKVLDDLQLTHEISVESLGAEPRQVVRFAPKPGSSASYELVTTQDMSLKMIGPDGQAMDMGAMMGGLTPTIVMPMTHTVGQPVADQLVPVQITMGAVRVEGADPGLQAQMAAAMKMVDGLSYRMLVEPDGDVAQVDVSVDSPELYELTQSMADQLLDQVPTFPDEPIGVGATWTVDMDMDIGGMSLVTHQRMTVTSISDEAIGLKTALTMEQGQGGGMPIPGLPAGADVDFTRFTGEGTGQLTTDLTTMSSTGSVTTRIGLGMKMVDPAMGAVVMEMDLEQKTEMRAP